MYVHITKSVFIALPWATIYANFRESTLSNKKLSIKGLNFRFQIDVSNTEGLVRVYTVQTEGKANGYSSIDSA